METLKFKRETVAPNEQYPDGAIKLKTQSGFVFSTIDINDLERIKTIESLPYLLERYCALCNAAIDIIPGDYKKLGDLKELTEKYYKDLLK